MHEPAEQDRSPWANAKGLPSAVEILAAYLEKSPIVQAVIRDLVNIARDDREPAEKHQWAEASLQAALFRHQKSAPDKRGAGVSREARQQVPGLKEAHQRMEEEERVFAANLGRLLGERNMTRPNWRGVSMSVRPPSR